MSATTSVLQPPGAQTGPSAFQKLLDFLNKLDDAGLAYRLSHPREETVAVELAVPGERWEVEFFADGSVEAERFRSDGHIATDESLLARLIANYV